MAKDKPGWDNPRNPRPKGAQKDVVVRDYGSAIDTFVQAGSGKSMKPGGWSANAKRKGK